MTRTVMYDREGDLWEKGWSIVYLSDKPYQVAWYAKYKSALIGPFIFRDTAVERARSFVLLPTYYQERLWAMHWERRALNDEDWRSQGGICSGM